MAGVEIEYCGEGDKPYISDLFLRTFKESPWNSKMSKKDVDSYLDSILNSKDSICLVAKTKDTTESKFAGFALGSKLGYTLNSEINENDTVYLSSITVEPKKRGMGIGNQLLSEYMKRAEEQNFRYISLITSTKSEETLNFYKKFSFSRLEDERDLSPENTKTGNICMFKRLNSDISGSYGISGQINP